MVVTSLLGQRPDPEEILPYTWTPDTWRLESAELKALPWCQNYRVLSAALLVLMAIFIGMFW